MSEWKPGDVAMCKYGRVFCAEGGWFFDDGSGPSENPRDLRPLVVIDPEKREQVERLVTLLRAQSHAPETADIMQAALREFANPTPPRPEEPTGLGALVERADGRRWVRGPNGWTNLDAIGAYPNWTDWVGVNEHSPVVRVLSEGVQS